MFFSLFFVFVFVALVVVVFFFNASDSYLVELVLSGQPSGHPATPLSDR